MKTLFSTDKVHARDRFDYWHGVACKTLVDHDSQPECRESFRAEIHSEVLAGVRLVLFGNSPMKVMHTSHHIARAISDELFICRQVAGRLTLEQNSRGLVLEAGDMTLLDPLLPYAGNFLPGSELLVLKVPRRSLEARLGKTRDMTVRSIKPVDAESSLASAFLAMLPAHAGKLAPTAAEIVRDQALDLVAVSLAKAMERCRPRVSSARSLALLSVRAAIDARISDPQLDAATVAGAAGISVRYANSVLAGEGTSIMRLIQEKRLAHCRRALEDPLQAHRTVSEIAYGWGFSNMTHFGRRFKAAYGLLPSVCRDRAKQL